MCFLKFDNFELKEEMKRIDKLAPGRYVFDSFDSN